MHDYLTIFDSSFIAPFGDGLEEEKIWSKMAKHFSHRAAFASTSRAPAKNETLRQKTAVNIKMAEVKNKIKKAEAYALCMCLHDCMNGQILRRSAGKLVPICIVFAIRAIV